MAGDKAKVERFLGKMVPPGIEPGSYPRQGYVLAIGLWDRDAIAIRFGNI